MNRLQIANAYADQMMESDRDVSAVLVAMRVPDASRPIVNDVRTAREILRNVIRNAFFAGCTQEAAGR